MLFAVILLLASLDVIKSRFLVKILPGLDGDLPFTLETGYIGVGESDDVQLFYYFNESEGNPEDDPLMIWLTGGPGCSSISGLMFEIGPFTINYAISTLEKPILKLVPYSWTKVANIIFLDQPVGTGFSYAKAPETYITNDTLSAKLAYSFLRKWLVDHPKFLSNPLYVGGYSYAGKMVPLIVQEIYNGNEIGEEPQMNIKGYTVGNPLTDTSGDYNSRIPFAHHMALLSDAIYKSAKENCSGEYLNVDPNNSLCIHDIQAVDKCLERINFPQILDPLCDTSNTLKSDLSRRDLRGLDKTSLDTWSLSQVQKQWCRVLLSPALSLSLSPHAKYLSKLTWVNSKCLIQPGSTECGYYVLKFMKEIVEKEVQVLENDNIGDGEKEYTDDDLDQICEEWAQYVANFIFRS